MGVVLGAAAILAVYFLWRLVRLQEVRTRLEAGNATLTQLTARLGSWQDAKRDGRLLEYVENAAAAFGNNDEEIKGLLALQRQDRYDLVLESIERGRPCRFLDEEDYDEFVPLSLRYIGKRPEPEVACSRRCDDAMSLSYIPADIKSCPFCGAPIHDPSPAKTQEDVAFWEKRNREWQACKKRFPEKISEEAALQERFDRFVAQQRADFDTAVAAFRNHNRK